MARPVSPPPAHAAARRRGVVLRLAAAALLVLGLIATAVLLRPDAAPSVTDAARTAAMPAPTEAASGPSPAPATTATGEAAAPPAVPPAGRATDVATQAARGAPATTPASRSDRTTPPSGTPVDVVLALVNAERAKAGCRAVRTDPRLAAAAAAHSADMAAHDYFSHTGRDGSAPGDRVTRAGFRWSRVGENIAMGQPTAIAVMTAWMNSSGHRANILNCDYTHVGVGLAYSGRRPVWTQDFGTPAG